MGFDKVIAKIKRVHFLPHSTVVEAFVKVSLYELWTCRMCLFISEVAEQDESYRRDVIETAKKITTSIDKQAMQDAVTTDCSWNV